MRKLTLALSMLVLGGCVTMAKVDSGDRAVGDRLTVNIDGAWNHLQAPGLGPAQTWTREGLTVDQLLLYSGIKNGELVHAPSRSGKEKDFAFRAGMMPDEIVAMFEGMLTRDGSSFKLTRLEPSPFGGLKGFRFDYVLTRKVDNVVLSGMGWGVVSKGELFAIVYMAPRLVFFSRHAAQVEKIALSAKIKE
jgi:hypothetical protein